jgi:hypothetical protein
LTPSAAATCGGGRLRLRGGLSRLGFGIRCFDCVLPRLLRRLASLTSLLFRALRLAARLLKLLLGVAELLLQALQFALQVADLAFYRADTVGGSILRAGRARHRSGAECDHRAAAVAYFFLHVRSPQSQEREDRIKRIRQFSYNLSGNRIKVKIMVSRHLLRESQER